jgi:hypothetical protein
VFRAVEKMRETEIYRLELGRCAWRVYWELLTAGEG